MEQENRDRAGLLERRIKNEKSACGKVSRVRHMVPGGSRESLPKRKVRFADHPSAIYNSTPQ